MIIGIDGNEANLEHRVGVNTYAYEILRHFHKIKSKKKYKNIKFRIYLKDKPIKTLPKADKNWEYKILPGKGLWIIRKLMPKIFQNKKDLDIFFTPSHYLPPFAPVPTVCSIMDLGYLEFSGQFRKYDYWQLKLWSARSMKLANKVFTISKTTANDIVRRYPSVAEKIVVTPLAYDKKLYNTKISSKIVRRVKEKYNINSEYVLFLGTLKPSKNIEGIIKAWEKIAPKFNTTKLVIAGKKGWLYESIYREVQKRNLQNNVIFTGFVDEEDKPGLIKGAKVFLLPSFWEGFGLDVLTSMACGIPTIVSNRGSLPEVAGKAGIYTNPDSPDDIAQKLSKVLTLKKANYAKIVQKGIKNANKYSWEKTAQTTLNSLINIQ